MVVVVVVVVVLIGCDCDWADFKDETQQTLRVPVTVARSGTLDSAVAPGEGSWPSITTTPSSPTTTIAHHRPSPPNLVGDEALILHGADGISSGPRQRTRFLGTPLHVMAAAITFMWCTVDNQLYSWHPFVPPICVFTPASGNLWKVLRGHGWHQSINRLKASLS